jgi:hypothetical protein
MPHALGWNQSTFLNIYFKCIEFNLGDSVLFQIFVASTLLTIVIICSLGNIISFLLHFNGYYKTSILFQKNNYHTFFN